MSWAKRCNHARRYGENQLMPDDRPAFREMMRREEEKRREDQMGPLREAVYALNADMPDTPKAKPYKRAAKRR